MSVTCAVCGDEFDARSPRAKFCSDTCRKRKQRGAEVVDSPVDDAPGPVEVKVRADIAALLTAHPMGESLAEASYAMARLVDRYPTMATNANRELRANLEALAGMGVGDDDDLGAALSNPDLPSAVRDPEEP